MTDLNPRLCVVAPVHNEEWGIAEFVGRVFRVLDQIPRSTEHSLLLVDDGSTDGTNEVLKSLVEREPRLRVLVLSRNFGHQAAVTAGLDYSSGDVVVVMDSDLQDNPAAIPAFLEKYQEGYDVVYAVRRDRKEPTWLRFAYRLHYRLTARVSRPSLPRDAGDFSLMSRRVVDHIVSMPERQRYVRGLRAWTGFRQFGVEVERDARYAGKSGYSFGRLVNLAFDGLFAFSIVPIRLVLSFGVVALLLSVGYAGFALAVRLTSGAPPPGFTGLLLATTFLNGVVLLFLGVVGEYVGRIYEEVKGRPTYIVGSILQPGMSADG